MTIPDACSPALHNLFQNTISSFIRAFPRFAQDAEDLVSIIWLKLRPQLSDPTSNLRHLVDRLPSSRSLEKRLQAYLWTLLSHWASHQHHTSTLSPALFSELDGHAINRWRPLPCLEAPAIRSSPTFPLNWVDSWQAFTKAIRQHFHKRAPLLIAWLETGGDPKTARRLGLAPRTLTRDRQTLRRLYREAFSSDSLPE